LVRNSMQLFDMFSGLTAAREAWPDREKIIEESKQLLLSFMRYAVRRRMLMLILGLTAFVIPGIQIWLVHRQNQIIENQNKFFEIDVFDTTARGLTSGNASSRQVTSALLAKVDLDLLGGMVEGVFESDIGGAYTASDIDARSRRMQGAAFRGYLIAALSRQIHEHGDTMDHEAINEKVYPMFRAIIRDAKFRVPELLRISRSSATADSALAEEVSSYLLNLTNLMRTQFRLALSVEDQPRYFTTIASLIARVSGRRSSFGGEKSPFEEVFFAAGIEELLLDLAQDLPFGQPEPVIASDAGTVNRLKKLGFERLKKGIGNQGRVNWANFKRLAGAP